MSQVELKPCAHCGADGDDVEQAYWTDRARGYPSYVKCLKCGSTIEASNKDAVTALWNTRTPVTPPSDQGEEIEAPENGEPDPEWRAIRRAIDQFVGRVPVINKHRAVHNTVIAETVARLDAAGDREAADVIVWQCWYRALDRERERFLLADAEERIAARKPEALEGEGRDTRNTETLEEGR